MTSQDSFVAFIRNRRAEQGISLRQIAAQSSIIKLTRLHAVLHTDPDKRLPIRLDEASELCRILGIDYYGAALGSEMSQDEVLTNHQSTDHLLPMVAAIMKGLGPAVYQTIMTIEGLEFSDLRPSHGRQIQALMIDIVREKYTALAEHKDFRSMAATIEANRR